MVWRTASHSVHKDTFASLEKQTKKMQPTLRYSSGISPAQCPSRVRARAGAEASYVTERSTTDLFHQLVANGNVFDAVFASQQTGPHLISELERS